jgi:pimeloyl-ACP methyl ester carboxylesterase
MPQVTTPEGIALEYETIGSAADPALLLVMGFATQLIAWPRALCERLAAGGRFVVRFDNRDCGLWGSRGSWPLWPELCAAILEHTATRAAAR